MELPCFIGTWCELGEIELSHCDNTNSRTYMLLQLWLMKPRLLMSCVCEALRMRIPSITLLKKVGHEWLDSLYFKKALVHFQSSRQCTGSIIWDLVVTEAAECHNNGKIMIPPQLVPYTCGLSLRQYQLLFVCLSAMELKVFHFLISKLFQRPHPSDCCNEKSKYYIGNGSQQLSLWHC